MKSDRLLPLTRFADPNHDELLRRLVQSTDLRPTIIARGKMLVADPNYPNSEIVRHIGRLLGDKL